MGLSIIEFANLCHVSRQAVYKGIDGKLVVREQDGGIDPTHPINRTYLEMHATGRPSAARKPAQGVAKAGKASPRKAARGDGGRRERPKEQLPDGLDDETRAALDESEEGEDGEDGYSASQADEKLAETIRKTRIQADILEIVKAEKFAELLPRNVVASMLGSFSQYIFTEFAESPKNDSFEICNALSVPGKEKRVFEILSARNQLRLENVKRMATDFLTAMKKAK